MAKKKQNKTLNNGFEHTEEAIKQRGEVFTPTTLVNEMLDKLPPEVFTDPTKTFLDNSCGNGAFLFEVMRRKMKAGASHIQSLKTIFGVELHLPNTIECKNRLSLNIQPSHPDYNTIWNILNNHIICADALDNNHSGWNTVGFYWNTLYPNS